MRIIGISCAMLGFLAGCAPGGMPPVQSTLDPTSLQAMQTRGFATPDHPQALRAVIATFQDLGYNIDKVEAQAGTVSASKAADLSVTATILPGAGATTTIQADALIGVGDRQYEVDDPAFYSNYFFQPLSRNLPLASAQVPAAASYAPAYTAPPNSAYPAPPPSDAATPSNEPWHASPSP